MSDLFSYAAQQPVSDAPEGIPSEVATLFEKLALGVSKAGHARYSADAILHRIRWHFQIEKGDREFKCNDHWTAPLSRWFLARHPNLAATKFFETREKRQTEAA